MTNVQLFQLNKMADHILRTPGNASHGKQLEMAFVLDETSDRTYVLDTVKELAASLKRHDRVFENVRCNVVGWSLEGCTTHVLSMSYLVLGKAGEVMEDAMPGEKASMETLAAYLKLYHARSKLIIVITEGDYQTGNAGRLCEHFSPFLKTRLLVVTPQQLMSGSQIFQQALQKEEHQGDKNGNTGKANGG